MLVWFTLPFYDFCGFRSVAVNSVYKLQFFTFISYRTRKSYRIAQLSTILSDIQGHFTQVGMILIKTNDLSG